MWLPSTCKRIELETFCRHAGKLLLQPGFHTMGCDRSPKNVFNDCSDHVKTPWSDPTAIVATGPRSLQSLGWKNVGDQMKPLSNDRDDRGDRKIFQRTLQSIISCPRTACCSWKKRQEIWLSAQQVEHRLTRHVYEIECLDKNRLI